MSNSRQIQNQTVTDIYQIADAKNNLIYTTDGYVTAAIKVSPKSMALLTAYQKNEVVSNVASALKGTQKEFQVLIVGKPADINSYKNWMENKIRDAKDYVRKDILQRYLRKNTSMVMGGRAAERLIYIIMRAKAMQKDINDLTHELSELKSRLGTAGVTCQRATTDDLKELLNCIGNPSTAAYTTDLTNDYITLYGGN